MHLRMLHQLAKTLLIIFIFSSVLLPIKTQATEIDRIVAVVNNDVITWLELYKEMEIELTRNIKGPISADEKLKVFKENESAFLDEMINLKVQLSEAQRLDIYVGNSDLDAAIKSIMKTNSMDRAQFESALRAEGMSLSQFRERLRREITIRRLIDREVRSKIVITDEDVLAIAGNEESQYRISQIVIKKEDGESIASEILKKIKDGADFRALAIEFSDDPQAKTTGGDLGFIRFSELSSEYQDALKGLKVGQVSSPFKSPFGIHIVRIDEIKTSESFEEARARLFEDAMLRQYKEWLRGLRERSFVEIKL